MGYAKLANCNGDCMDEKMHGTENIGCIDLKVVLVDTNCMTFAGFYMDTTHIVEDWSMFVEGRHSVHGFPKISDPLLEGNLRKAHL